MKKKFIYISNHEPVTELSAKYKLIKPQFALWASVPKNDVKGFLMPLVNECEEMIRSQKPNGIIVTGEPRAVYLIVERFSREIPCYSTYSTRKSIDQINPDGSVTKTSVFKFEGLVPYETSDEIH